MGRELFYGMGHGNLERRMRMQNEEAGACYEEVGACWPTDSHFYILHSHSAF